MSRVQLALNVSASEFLPRFQALRNAVMDHAIYEQCYEFSRLRKDAGVAERPAMLRFVEVAEPPEPTHPHAGVESVTDNVLRGAPTAVIDRTTDLICKARSHD